jgi:hypothetical protein
MPLFTGAFYQGAYGPTIVLKASSVRSAQWLHEVFMDLARGAKAVVDLSAEPEVMLSAVKSFRLQCVDEQPSAALRQISSAADGSDFEWFQDASHWHLAAGFLEPFVSGNTGHQYLTNEAKDDALVEVSFGESEVYPRG